MTRPQPGAEETAERLSSLGHDAIILPLSRIEPLFVPEPYGSFDAGVASSVNSIRHAPDSLLQALRDKPVHVVGEATAAAARGAGMQVGLVAEGAADLAGRLAGAAPRGTRFAYLCGRVRLPIFQERMAAAGFEVRPFELYDTKLVRYATEEVLERLGPRVDAVLFYSSLAAHAWMELAARPDIGARIDGATAFCLSARIAEELAGWPRVHAAHRPDEDSLLLLLSNRQARTVRRS